MSNIIVILVVAFLGIGLIILLISFMSKQTSILSENATDLSDVMPIQFIDDNMIVNGNGDITIGYNIFLPEVFTLSDSDAEQIHTQLEGLLKMLPAGSVFHQQNFYYTGNYTNNQFSDNVLVNANYKHCANKDILKSYSNIYITFRNSDNKRTSETTLTKKPRVPFVQPFKDIVKRKKEIETTLINFENALASISFFTVKKMHSQSLNNAVYDYMSQTFSTPTEDASKESLDPISTTNGNLMIGNKYVQVLTLIEEGSKLDYLSTPQTGKILNSNIEMPENIRSKASMVYPLGLGLPFDHILNVIIEITDNDNVVSAINTEKTSLNFLANFYPPAKIKQQEQQAFIDTVQHHGYQTARTSLNVIVSDTDYDMLQKKISMAKQGFIKMNHANCYTENEENANLFFCSMPGNAASVYRYFVNTTTQALCYIQKENMYMTSAEGFLFQDRFGTPVLVDMWDKDMKNIENRNRLVFGPSGSGKSFLVNNYVLQSIHAKRDVVIIDIGGSYRSMINLNGGKYFDSNKTSEFCFNPFLCDKNKDGDYLYMGEDKESVNDNIDTISSIISYIWKGKEQMNNTEKAFLDRSIKNFYEYVNKNKIFPTLIEYSDFLTLYQNEIEEYEKKKIDYKEIQILLEPYTTGDLKHLLNAKENIDVVNDTLLCFDMEGVCKKDYFPLIVIIVLQLVIGKIKHREGIAKTLIIDEALDFLMDEKFGVFIGYLYRTFRKKEGEIALAAQNVMFLKSAPQLIRDSILINTDTKIILDHSKHQDNLPELQNMLSFSDAEIEMIKSLQRSDHWREFFCKLGKHPYIFRNEVSPEAAVAFDSRQSTIVRIRELIKETGSTYAAINKYINQKREEK